LENSNLDPDTKKYARKINSNIYIKVSLFSLIINNNINYHIGVVLFYK
jgi:hypothetical protein